MVLTILFYFTHRYGATKKSNLKRTLTLSYLRREKHITDFKTNCLKMLQALEVVTKYLRDKPTRCTLADFLPVFILLNWVLTYSRKL